MSILSRSAFTDATPKYNAASSMLERVVLEERDRLTGIMCKIRFVFAVLNVLAVFPTSEVEGISDTTPSRYGAVFYAFFATVLLVAVLKSPKARRWAAYSPAVFDVPFVGIIEYVQAQYVVKEGMTMPASVIMLAAFLMLLVIPPTALFAYLIGVASKTPLPVILNVVVSMTGIGALGWFVVGQIRGLVRLSRQRDLVGKYILGPRLGAGGMAEVFLATYAPEGGFERKVAVKRILPNYANSEQAVAMFRREAELCSRLVHPNVIQVFDFGADGDSYFFAMEYVDGVSLADVINYTREHKKRIPVATVAYIARELASALAYVHSRTDDDGKPLDLVHRDFNPPNVLVSSIGEIKLADFGIARVGDAPGLTQPGMMRGKLIYAAPEQLRGNPLDGRADLFALGLTLVEVATSERAIEATTDVGVAKTLLEGPVRTAREMRADFPVEFDDIIANLLVLDRDARTQRGEDVVSALDAICTQHDANGKGRRGLCELIVETRAARSAPRTAETATRAEQETKPITVPPAPV